MYARTSAASTSGTLASRRCGTSDGYEDHVVKDAMNSYRGGITRSWLKVKVPGWTDPEDRFKRVRLTTALVWVSSGTCGYDARSDCRQHAGEDHEAEVEQLAELCACVWSKLPEGGWERKVSAQSRKGEDPGWRLRAFPPRFGAALEACDGRRL
jgi:hypothetical protein